VCTICWYRPWPPALRTWRSPVERPRTLFSVERDRISFGNESFEREVVNWNNKYCVSLISRSRTAWLPLVPPIVVLFYMVIYIWRTYNLSTTFGPCNIITDMLIFSVLCWFRNLLYCVNNLWNLNLYCSSTRILSFSQCVYDHADTFDNNALECSLKGKVSALWFSGGVLEIIRVPEFMNNQFRTHQQAKIRG